MSLTQLVLVGLDNVSLGDGGVEVTDAMTKLTMLYCVDMTTEEWDRFVSSLFTPPPSLFVMLRDTDIDDGTSPLVIVTRERDYDYERLEFCTISNDIMFGEVKSRKYQGVFEVKSRVKTWQVRGIWSQQLEH